MNGLNHQINCSDTAKRYNIILVIFTLGLSILLVLVVMIGQSALAKTNTVVATIPVSRYPFGVTYDSANGQVYVANTNSDILAPTFTNSHGSVSIIDTYNVIKTVSVGNDSIGVAYDPPNNRIYVSNSGSQTVSVINGTTDTILGSPIPVQLSPWGIAYDSANKHIYVANAGSMNVSAISTVTNKVDATIPVKAIPHGVAYDPANGDIYVANQGSGGNVSVINATSNTVIEDIAVGPNPEGVAYDPANGDIYVTLWGSNRVAIIDGTTNTVINDVIVGSHPFGAAYDSTHKRMYVTNSFSNDVSVINATSNTLVDNSTIQVGNRPLDIAFNPSNNAMYVTNSLSNTVSVLLTLDRGELDLAASADNTTANSGNSQPQYIIASVTDEDGQPLVGLTLNNFKVTTMVSPDDGIPIQITSVAAGTLPGYYRINIVPSGNATWKSGDYIFSIVATNEQAKGQNLVHMSIH